MVLAFILFNLISEMAPHSESLNIKNEIRKSFLKKRLAMPQNEVEANSQLICLNLFINFFLLKGDIGFYSPIKNEVNPLFLLDFGLQNSCLPVTNNEEMIFKKWHKGDDCKIGKFGVIEPLELAEVANPEIILVPLVAFDKNLNRIGYGKGFYDKYLSNFKGLKLGLAFELQLAKSIPTEPFDIKLDYIITEYKIYGS